jgi:hypothetical protein
MHLPPGFGGMNLSLPRATIEAFASRHSIFPQLSFNKGGMGGISEAGWQIRNSHLISGFSSEKALD